MEGGLGGFGGAFGSQAEDLVLPPPASSVGDLGVLPSEMWKRIALCLGPRSLCVASAASEPLGIAFAKDPEVWATLCLEHFPKMYASVVLAQRAGAASEGFACAATQGGGLAASRSAGKGRRGHKGATTTAAAAGSLAAGAAAGGAGRKKQRAKRGQAAASADATGGALEGEAATASRSPCLKSAPSDCSTSLGSSPSATGGPPSPWLSSEDGVGAGSDGVAAAAPPPPPPPAIDWKDLFAKRWLKKLEWDRAKGVRDRGFPAAAAGASSSDTAAALGVAPEQQSDGQMRFSELSAREMGLLSDAAHRIKICTFCGGKYSPGEARRQPMGCCFHPGVFAPADPTGWTSAHLKQLHQHAKQALKNAGGASWVQRHPRASRGHGHWSKGLGVFSPDKAKFRYCLEGITPAAWSCCGAGSLFAEGCKRGMHRHF